MKKLSLFVLTLSLALIAGAAPKGPAGDAPFIVVSAPAGGAALTHGSAVAIRWHSLGVTPPMTIVLWRNGAKIGLITTDSSANGKYDWIVGRYEGGMAQPGPGYVIRVRTGDSSVMGESAPFSIVLEQSLSLQPTQPQIQGPEALDPVLSFDHPAGQETLTAEQPYDLKWKSKNMTGYLVDITLDFGSTVNTTLGPAMAITLARNLTVTDGHYLWTVNHYDNPATKVLAGTYPGCTLRFVATKPGGKYVKRYTNTFTIVVPAS